MVILPRQLRFLSPSQTNTRSVTYTPFHQCVLDLYPHLLLNKWVQKNLSKDQKWPGGWVSEGIYRGAHCSQLISCMVILPMLLQITSSLDKMTQSIPSLTQPCNKMLVRCRSHSAKYPRSRLPLTKWHHLAFIYLRWPVGLATSVARPPIFIVHLLVYLLSVLTEEKSKSDFAWGSFCRRVTSAASL
jgi:hypothetical protein